MGKHDLEYQLRMEIKNALSKVSKVNSPNIWAAFHSAKGVLNLKGYARIEGKIIQKIISGQLTPEGAIPQLEQEMDLI